MDWFRYLPGMAEPTVSVGQVPLGRPDSAALSVLHVAGNPVRGARSLLPRGEAAGLCAG